MRFAARYYRARPALRHFPKVLKQTASLSLRVSSQRESIGMESRPHRAARLMGSLGCKPTYHAEASNLPHLEPMKIYIIRKIQKRNVLHLLEKIRHGES